MRQKGRINARPRIPYLDFDVTIVLAHRDLNLAPSWRKFCGVRKNVPNYLLQTIRIPGNQTEARIKKRFNLNFLGFHRRAHRIQRGIYNRYQIDRTEFKLKLAGDYSRHVQYVFDDLLLRPGV